MSELTPDLIRAMTPSTQSRHAQDFLLTLLPALSEGLTQVAMKRPADPHAFLASVLLRHSHVPASSPIRQQLEQSVGSSSSSSSSASAPAPAARSRPLHIIIAGAACSGKGTQCELIKEKYPVVHISTGDLLRAAVEQGTELGKVAKEYMDKGLLIPDDLMIGIVKSRLQEPDCIANGWLLDGFPRSPGQAQALVDAGITADVFFVLDVPDSVLIERVVGRRMDPETGIIYHVKFNPPKDPAVEQRWIQRSDDTEEKIQVRLQGYHSHVSSIEGLFRHIMLRLDGNRDKRVIFGEIDAKLRALQ